MNLGPNPVNTTYQYLLNQSGTNITLGNNGAVNWNGANVVTRTGAQTIGGTKTFTDNIVGNGGFGLGASTNTFGDDSNSNYFGGGNTTNNYFGGIFANDFGFGASANTFGGGSTQNNFGSTATTNTFGDSADSNVFGYDANTNTFGYDANTNTFGDSADSNSFGFDAVSNTFGNSNGQSVNEFGVGATNTFGGGLFNSQIRLFLQEFSGLSSQDGQFGELRVSGSGLYVCTGTTGGWRRTFLQSF